MSGGSFNYLYTRFGTADEYASIADTLCDAGYGRSKAQADLRTLQVALENAQRLAARLANVLKAVEWTASCDYSDDDLRAAVDEYDAQESEGK